MEHLFLTKGIRKTAITESFTKEVFFIMNVGYARVSAIDQNPARQEALLNEMGAERIFIDKSSGKNIDRTNFKKMMAFIRNGDKLIIESLSRISRDLKDLLRIVEMLEKKGIQLVSAKENIDTGTPQGKLMLNIFGALSQFEREAILERQKEGIALAKADGKYKGRKPIEVGDTFFHVTNMWQSGQISLKEALITTGLSKTTFFRKCKKYCIRKKITWQ